MKLLDHLGVPYSDNTDDYTTDCPFCGKENKLSMSKQDGHVYQCWSCKESGNAITFMRHWYSSLPELTKAQAVKFCQKKTGVDMHVLRREGVRCEETDTDSLYWFPVHNREGNIIALHKYVLSTNIAYASPKPWNCSVLGLANMADEDTVWIAEGHADYLILRHLKNKHSARFDVLGSCGSSFSGNYLHLLEGKHVVLLFDNDDAGRSGIKSVAKRIKASGHSVASLKHIDWSRMVLSSFSEIPEKFDLRDLFNESNGNVLEFVEQHLQEVDMQEVVTIEPQACDSFAKLMEIYRHDLTVTDSMVDCLALGMATHIAVALEGDPLWMYLVGAPSSGKSTICELLASDEIHTRPLSKFTGLVSGSRQGSHLVPLLQGKCVIVKDGTLLLESSPQQLANVYGELRDIFDGSLNAEYRNGVSASFSNVSFGMVIGITERIYSLNMAALGERFLHCRLETNREVETSRNRKAIQSIFEATARTRSEGNENGDARSFPKQRAYTAGFLSYLHTKLRNEDILRPGHDDHDIRLIQALGDVIACSRAQAPRSKEFGSSELLYDARPEASTRVVKQLSRLALCLCYVLGVNHITADIRRLLTKVALDTSFSRQHTIIKHVALSQKGLQRQGIAMATGIPLETISRRIDDLLSLGILISNDTEMRPVRGRTIPLLRCAPWIENAFRMIQKYENSSSNDTTKANHPQLQKKGANKAKIPRPPAR